MTKNENERLAVVESKLEDLTSDMAEMKTGDIAEIKSDLKTLLRQTAVLIDNVKGHEKRLCEQEKKTSSALWMTAIAIVSFIGAIFGNMIKGWFK